MSETQRDATHDVPASSQTVKVGHTWWFSGLELKMECGNALLRHAMKQHASRAAGNCT